jgi:tRNA A-37 threonylcarbamoyl transferase component Bud32
MSKYYIKTVDNYELKMFKYINNLNLDFVPKIIKVDIDEIKIVMEYIEGMNIADKYGEDINEVPEYILIQIMEILKKLYNYGIIYPDITGYNFIEDKNLKIWIVDFEHCFFKNKKLGDGDEKQLDQSSLITKSKDFVEKQLDQSSLITKSKDFVEKQHIKKMKDFINGKFNWNEHFL